MTNPRKKFESMKTPKYPGGKQAFQEFMSKNIKVPKEAEEAKVVGTVIVGYDITDNGVVRNAHIIKGLGYGCDEEAIRVINLLRYERVKNRSLRITVHTKATIHFNQTKAGPAVVAIPAGEPDAKTDMAVNYTVTPSPPHPLTSLPAPEEPKSGGTSYTYTIDL
jgi:TonB family protein